MPQPREPFSDLPAPGPCRDADRIRDLGDGLVLRRATPDDVDALAEFNSVVHADPPDWARQGHLAVWTRELTDGTHPNTGLADFVLVHDTRADRLASTLCLVSPRMRYGRVELDAGNPELVGTHPEYRGRGLVTAQLEVVHEWSEQRGHALQLIDGIPWYYRQFGYEMAVQLNTGRRIHAGALPDGAPETSLRIREATGSDAGFAARVYELGTRRHRFAGVRSEDDWRYEIERDPAATRYRIHKIIESADGVPLCFYSHAPILWRDWLYMGAAEVAQGVAWSEVAPALIADLAEAARGFREEAGGKLGGVVLGVGSEHPLYQVAASHLSPEVPSYALYVRVPDLAGFLERVAPELEQRLAATPFADLTKRLRINLYRSGIEIVFEKGRVAGVSPWRPATDDRGDVSFPDLSFLQLLFGFRSLAQLDAAWPDCVVWNEKRRALVEALFPPQPSDPYLMA